MIDLMVAPRRRVIKDGKAFYVQEMQHGEWVNTARSPFVGKMIAYAELGKLAEEDAEIEAETERIVSEMNRDSATEKIIVSVKGRQTIRQRIRKAREKRI